MRPYTVPREVCDYSDLPADECDHCAHGVPQQARRKGRVVARISARYPGKCSACGDRWAEGDPIVMTDTAEGFWIHEECA